MVKNELQSTEDKEYLNRRYNLKNDVVFKAFFSRKGNEEYLIDFLNALLNIKITEINIQHELDLEKLDPEEKGGRLDLQAKLNDGVIVNIELQVENKHNLEGRTTFYSAKVISMETERGTDYNDINKVIMVNILDYEMFGFEDYISETTIVLDKHREYEVLKGIKWIFIELPKFRRKHPDMNDKVNQWLAIIDDYDREAIAMAEKKNKTIKKAKVELEYLTGDEEVKRLAFLREKWEMDRISDLNHAKSEGKKEVAKKLLEKNIPLEIIIETTGLTKEEIEKLK
ncbi:MAG: Rpn family recombination-promoting nuclease/putative transposase [Clostridia bacterium]|nr:Rpn family recombination-promoting nuclease/putative transposase [Clostridia bacterium]